MDLDDLIELDFLTSLLGYTDPRSVKSWCRRHKIKILPMGLKKYISKHSLTQCIDNQLVKFVKGNESQDIVPGANEKKTRTKIKTSATGAYQPNNEIISKYLTKYESNCKSKTT